MPFKKIKGEGLAAVLFAAPSVLGLLIFYIIPFVWMIVYSFLDSPVNGRFIGFKNYIDLIQNTVYQKAVMNTIIFTGISVPIIIILSLLLAILLNQKIYFKQKLRTSFIIPLIVPVASIILFFELFFDYHGFVNGMLSFLNISPIDWMGSQWAMGVVIVIYVWKNVGYNIVLFIAGLNGIPREYYEAAGIDGARAVDKFFNITIVYLMPTMFFVFIISIVNSFKVFREVYLIAGSYPHHSIYMLQHYINNMFRKLDYQKLVSSAMLMAVVVYAIVYILFKIQKKINTAIGN